MTHSRPVLSLIGCIAVSFIPAVLGGIASADAPMFYAQLVKPEWAPSAGLFGPVWTVLYLLMGIALWLVWRARWFHTARAEFSLFVVQLAFNALWSWLFFAWRLGGLAFMEIVVLWLLIVATLIAFWRVRPLAGLLLVPYLCWVSFAALLNFTLWRLNPGLL